MRAMAVTFVAMALTGCSSGSTGHSPASADGHTGRPGPAITSSASPHVDRRAHLGSLTDTERSEATEIAKRQQRKVTGTFIGATAFITRGTPFDPGSACDTNDRFLNIRLVWKADANFTHGHTPGSPPDGPRKDLVLTVDSLTGRICETGAGYRNVGAEDAETLLYGEWPSKADG